MNKLIFLLFGLCAFFTVQVNADDDIKIDIHIPILTEVVERVVTALVHTVRKLIGVVEVLAPRAAKDLNKMVDKAIGVFHRYVSKAGFKHLMDILGQFIKSPTAAAESLINEITDIAVDFTKDGIEAVKDGLKDIRNCP